MSSAPNVTLPTATDLRLLAASLLEVTSTAGEFIRAGASGTVGTGSPADKYLASDRNLPTGGPANLIYDAHMSMLLTSASAVDHVELYVAAAQRQIATVALATTVRGALENMARTNYLLRAASMDELVMRLVASSNHDVFHPVRVDSKFQDPTGHFVDPRAYPQRLTRIASQLGLPASKMPNMEDLVKMLLRPMLHEEAADAALREVYSQLSGVAHGNITALGMYQQHEGSGKLVYPLELAILHAAYLFTSACSVAEVALDYFGLGLAAKQQWIAVRDRATTATVSLWARSTA